MDHKGKKRGRPKLKFERPHLPFNYLKIYEGYKGPHYNGALVLELDAPGALFAPVDMKLVDYFTDMSGETLILESTSLVRYRDKSAAEFTLLLRHGRQGCFVVQEEYKKNDSLGCIKASNLYMEVSKGQFSGYDFHLKHTIRADDLFTIEKMTIFDKGQPCLGGESMNWVGGNKYTLAAQKNYSLCKGSRVVADEGTILERAEKYGEPACFVDTLNNWMGEDYLHIKDNKAALLPSVVADIKDEFGISKVLINGYWIEEERLYEGRKRRTGN